LVRYLPFVSQSHCLLRQAPVDVVLVLDTSSSMTEPAGDGQGTKLDAARTAAVAFLGILGPDDHAGLIAFHAKPFTLAPLSADRAPVVAAMSDLPTGFGTRLDQALGEAEREIGIRGRPGGRSAVVLLTDGLQDGGDHEAVLKAAGSLKDRGVTVHTVGLGRNLDAELLRSVASSPARFHPSPGPADLRAIYESISVELACR
jgi:Mg-chelatase subunit ChlD